MVQHVARNVGQFGWLLYNERIDAFVAAGAALILFGNMLNLPRRRPKAADLATS